MITNTYVQLVAIIYLFALAVEIVLACKKSSENGIPFILGTILAVLAGLGYYNTLK